MGVELLEEAHEQLTKVAHENKLHWAQTDALRAFKHDIENGHRRIYGDIAMGAGKTAIELSHFEALHRAGLDVRGTIFTQGVNDVRNILENEAPRWAPELVKSGKLSRFLPSQADQATPFNVATYAGGVDGIKRGLLRKPDIAYLDEAQSALSDLRSGVFSYLGQDIQLIGLTATPAYRHNKSLDHAGYKESYKLPFETAIARSILCSYRNILLDVGDSNVSLDDVEIVRGDYDEQQVEKLMRHHSVMEAVKHHVLNWVHPETGESFFDRKGMISCCSVRHAVYVAQELNKSFSHLLPSGMTFCEPIWVDSKYEGHKSRDELNRIIDRHKQRQTLFLATQNLLLTGHDDPKIDTVLNLRPTSSLVLVPQRGGRAVRFDHENPDKEAHIIDVVLGGNHGKQKLFADYAGSGFVETLQRQKRRSEYTYPPKRPPPAFVRPDQVADVSTPPYKVYYRSDEVRSYVLTKEKREAIAKKPWLARITPALQDVLIKQDIPSIDEIVRRVRRIAAVEGWDEDLYKAKGQHRPLSKKNLVRALTGGFVQERARQNKDFYNEKAKRWKSTTSALVRAKNKLLTLPEDSKPSHQQREVISGYQEKIKFLEREMSRPLKHIYSMTEVAVSMALNMHPSRLFGDIKNIDPLEGEYETHYDVTIVPQEHRVLRTIANPTALYEPDHIFPEGALGQMMQEGGDYVQKEFASLFSAAALDGFMEQDKEDASNLLSTHVDSDQIETLVKDMVDDLTDLKPVQENALRRYYQATIGNHKNKKERRDVAALTAEEFRYAALYSECPSLTDINPDLDQQLNADRLRERIGRALITLTPREERVLRMRFGLGDTDDRTLEFVAQEFGITRERVRQIENKALRKLRHPSRSRTLQAFLDKDPDLEQLEL